MLGLIKKDFLLIKSNLKSLIFVFIIFFLMMLKGAFDITFVIPLIGTMLFISTFSYDEFNNWDSYAVTLPTGRKNIVKAKYIASFLLAIVLTVVSLIISIVICIEKDKGINIEEIMSLSIGSLLSATLIMSLLYPIIFKFGSTNGRIILFIFVFGLTGIIGLVANLVDISSILNIINMLEKYLFIIIPFIMVIILGISYLISSKIYSNKEF